MEGSIFEGNKNGKKEAEMGMKVRKEYRRSVDVRPSEGRPQSPRKRVRAMIKRLGFPVIFSVVYPLVIFYGMRALGISALYSLVFGSIPIVVFQLLQFRQKRQPDLLGIFIFVVLGISVLLTFVTGNPRFMLAKAGFFTMVVGLVFLVSLWFRKPLVLIIATYLLERMEVPRARLDRLWEERPIFRRVWQIATLIWGFGILINAALVFVMAYILPVDVVPFLNTLVHLIIFVVLQVVTQRLYRRNGIWAMIFMRAEGAGIRTQDRAKP